MPDNPGGSTWKPVPALQIRTRQYCMLPKSPLSDPPIIAIANQKGGVGKTTTAVNLSVALADLGHKVRLIDLDPQGNASTGLGISLEDRQMTSYDLLSGDSTPDKAALATDVDNL